MSGLAQGFLGGFNAMEGAIQRRENNDMRERQFQAQQQQMGLNNQYRQDQLALQKSADERAAAESAARMTGYGLQNELNKLQIGNFQTGLDQQTEKHNSEMELQKARTTAVNQQNKADKRAQGLQRINTYTTTGDWAGFVTDPTFKGTDIELLQSAFGADKAIALNQAFQKGDRQSVVSNFNSLYKSKLNRNVGNMTGRDDGIIKDIEAIDYEEVTDENGNSRIKIPVRVTTDKGQYTSYISEMRGIDPDDPEKVFTPEELIGKVGAMGQLATILKSSGVYDQVGQGVGRFMTSNMPTDSANGPTAKQKEWATIQQIFGDKGLKQYVFDSRQRSQDDALQRGDREAIDKLQTMQANGYIDITPEEMDARARKLASDAYNFSQNYDPNAAPAPNPKELTESQQKLLQQAADAIKNGKDPQAVRNLLIERGIPENQINL